MLAFPEKHCTIIAPSYGPTLRVALWRIRKDEPRVMLFLVAIQSDEEFADFAAVFALGEMAEAAEEAVPELAQMLKKVHPSMRPHIAMCRCGK